VIDWHAAAGLVGTVADDGVWWGVHCVDSRQSIAYICRVCAQV